MSSALVIGCFHCVGLAHVNLCSFLRGIRTTMAKKCVHYFLWRLGVRHELGLLSSVFPDGIRPGFSHGRRFLFIFLIIFVVVVIVTV